MSLVGAVRKHPGVGRLGRRVADLADLERSSLVQALERVAPRAHGRLLDVGCGDKPYEYMFLPFAESYIGIEHEATYAATSASTRSKADLRYDGVRLPFPDESFDTVLSLQVLEHTPQPGALLAEMARVLREGGLMIITVPFSFRLHEEPHDYFRFTPHSMRELCGTAGLAIEEITARGSLWSVLGHKLNTYLGLNVGHLGGLAQIMGKLPHERTATAGARLWTLPVVVPAMIGLAFWARILDRALPDPTEMLGFTILARRQRTIVAGEPEATHRTGTTRSPSSSASRALVSRL